MWKAPYRPAGKTIAKTRPLRLRVSAGVCATEEWPRGRLHLLVGFHVPPGQDGAALRLTVGALRLVRVLDLGEIESYVLHWNLVAALIGDLDRRQKQADRFQVRAWFVTGNQHIRELDLQILQLFAAGLSHHEVCLLNVRAVGAVQHQ